MFIRKLASGTTVVVFSLIVGACQYSPDVAQRTISYNESIADSTNNLFLLNVLRAMERQPTYYTRNQSNTASASVAPTLSGTFPWGSSPTRSISSTVNSNPFPPGSVPGSGASGFLNSVAVGTSVVKSALTLSPSFAASESNQLSLLNLDDQPSTNGLLAQVTVQQISNYSNEGYNPEQLDLLYLARLTVPRHLLRNLPDAISEYCGAKARPDVGRPIQPDLNCQYFFGDKAPGFSFAVTGGGQNLATGSDKKVFHKYVMADLRLESTNVPVLDPVCFGYTKKDASDPVALRSFAVLRDIAPQNIIDRLRVDTPLATDSGDAVQFTNDPAIMDTPDPAEHPEQHIRTFKCFKQVLTALLALDFGPTDPPVSALYRIPLSTVRVNSRYFSDITQQGLDVALVKRVSQETTPDVTIKTPTKVADDEEIGVCKKPGDKAFAFSGDAYVKALFALPDPQNP